MFTGIIEEVGTVRAAGPGEITIGAELVMADLAHGQSIAIDGVDLTVTSFAENAFSANVMAETYRRSTLAGMTAGTRVNLERAALPTRLSGHIVRGVVEGVARVEARAQEDDDLIYRFSAESDLLRFILLKGPVAVDGASFTVIGVGETSFTVSIVQYSQTHTTITDRQVGDLVNLETDILARLVAAAVDARLGDWKDPL
jgi:riboflavin synthase